MRFTACLAMPPRSMSPRRLDMGLLRFPVLAGRQPARFCDSPVATNASRVEQRLVADKPQILDLRLSDQHSIERVAVSDGELASALGMYERNRECPKALADNVRGDCPRWGGPLQLTEAYLGGNLPRRGGADEYLIGFVSDCPLGFAREMSVERGPPQQ